MMLMELIKNIMDNILILNKILLKRSSPVNWKKLKLKIHNLKLRLKRTNKVQNK